MNVACKYDEINTCRFLIGQFFYLPAHCQTMIHLQSPFHSCWHTRLHFLLHKASFFIPVQLLQQLLHRAHNLEKGHLKVADKKKRC